MATDCFPGCVNIVVSDAELFASLFDNWCDLGVVGLDYPREEMVSCLMVQGANKHCPEPATGGIVLCGRYLHLSPDKKQCNVNSLL